uniref:B box-type domain-containing protein n=1 Tax=Timema douglasi TaxID=61478 RepID=A0A7R8VHT1_TIMDO|nr:unnamed protein product [Timema douglasi]
MDFWSFLKASSHFSSYEQSPASFRRGSISQLANRGTSGKQKNGWLQQAKTILPTHLDLSNRENNVVVCPVCRVHCHANNLIENQFLLEVSGSSSEANATDPSSDLKCTSCHENSPATSWCVECSEYICDGCVQTLAGECEPFLWVQYSETPKECKGI